MQPLDLVNDIVVFDMDGVLSKYEFGEEKIKIMDLKDWVRMNMKRDMYFHTPKTTLFDELIDEKNPLTVFVLSVAGSSFEQHGKLHFLERNYPFIEQDNVIFVADKSLKVAVMEEMRLAFDNMGKQDTRLVLIEDNVSVMQDIESLHNEKLRCFLVSDFI